MLEAATITDWWTQETPGGAYPDALRELYDERLCDSAFQEIASWPGYAPSPLRSLSLLADRLGLTEIRYQDESGRFGLGSFKALGGAYAVMCKLSVELGGVPLAAIRAGEHRAAAASVTVATATDGNHGRSVAWGAQQAGCGCKIFVHREVSVGRQQAMAAFGAEVIRVDGDYDDSVRACAQAAAERGWHVISDTSYGDYREVPRQVMAGYSVIAWEVLAGMQPPPTHLFVQAGVGGLAGAVAARLWMGLGAERPKTVIVEADRAACVIASLRTGTPKAVTVEEETVMAGLSCGEISLIAFEILSKVADAVLTIPDDAVPVAMRAMADGEISGAPIEAGECAVPGILALAASCESPAVRGALALDASSHVLVIGCEGATDPDIYQRLLAKAA